jgi:hypothetical protein
MDSALVNRKYGNNTHADATNSTNSYAPTTMAIVVIANHAMEGRRRISTVGKAIKGRHHTTIPTFNIHSFLELF